MTLRRIALAGLLAVTLAAALVVVTPRQSDDPLCALLCPWSPLCLTLLCPGAGTN